MTELIQSIYPHALDAGVSQELFWEASVRELFDLLDSHSRTSKERFKQDVMLRFVEADAIASRVGYIFADRKKRRTEDIVQPWMMFPDLFGDEAPEREREDEEKPAQRIDPALELHKQRMKNFADRWNAKHGG